MLLKKQHISIEITEKAKNLLATRGFTPKYGAHQVACTIRNYVRRPISKMIVSGTLVAGNTIIVDGADKDSYELENCNFGFSQGVDANGKPQTEVRGGTISLTYGGLPQQDLLRWVLGSTKYEDGAIVVCDDNNEPLEKIFFEQAACVGLEIDYTQQGKGYI